MNQMPPLREAICYFQFRLEIENSNQKASSRSSQSCLKNAMKQEVAFSSGFISPHA